MYRSVVICWPDDTSSHVNSVLNYRNGFNGSLLFVLIIFSVSVHWVHSLFAAFAVQCAVRYRCGQRSFVLLLFEKINHRHTKTPWLFEPFERNKNKIKCRTIPINTVSFCEYVDNFYIFWALLCKLLWYNAFFFFFYSNN